MKKTFNYRFALYMGVLSLMLGMISFGPLTHRAVAAELDFNLVAPTSGSISYDGTGGALIGSNMDVDTVVGLATPTNANVTSTCLSCVLNFTSGAFTSSGGATPGVNNAWWRFGSGGSITITGGVHFQGGTPNDISLGTTLLSGTFGSAFVQDLGAPGFKVTFGNFTDTKDASLLSYYGLPSGLYAGAITLLFLAPDNGVGSAISSTSMIGGTISNIAAVPLPGAALLFFSGLSALTYMCKRLTV